MIHNFGFMQGRLSDQIKGKIQAFPWDTWQEEFKIANEVGLNLMEWTLDHDGLYENPLLTNAGRKTIKQLSTKSGVNIPSLTGDCFMQAPFWKANNPNIQKQLKNDFLSVLKACSELNIQLLVVPLVDNGCIKTRTEELILIEFLIEITPILRKKNLKIAFETDFQPNTNKRFIDNFDPNFFGLNYDTGNSAALGFNPEIEFASYSSHIINVHLKDRLFMGETVPLGLGDANFQNVFKLLKKRNYNGNYILQTARAIDGKHVEALIGYKQYIEKIWNKTYVAKR